MTLRKTVFWFHLACGLTAGIVIALMSATGIAIAFEEEILDWVDRNVSRVTPAEATVDRMDSDVLMEQLRRAHPDEQLRYYTRWQSPERADVFHTESGRTFYSDPFRGTIQETRADGVHHFLHELEEWHRWLGTSGSALPFGRLVTGISNLAFLGLCLSGLYLWFPRRWSWRAVRSILWFRKRSKGKARDFNWHHVFGFWSLPVLTVLAATAVVISYQWGHDLPFRLAGETPPEARNFGMMAVPPPDIPEPLPGSRPLDLDTLLAAVTDAYPEWVSIGTRIGADQTADFQAVKFDLTLPDFMPSRAYVPVEVDPFTGQILQAIHFHDRSPGLRARVWIRFLHTGGAFGFWGKLVATLATAASLVLVYTGFALSWRRFKG